MDKIESRPLGKVEKPKKVSGYFGSHTFNIRAMQKRVSKKTLAAFRHWLAEGITISVHEADEIAGAMKDWAVEKGAVYYAHWFQPMTGLTAEKHDSFISLQGAGQVTEKFSGSRLILGEPDASSFPSGGIRSTFEARGYTAWDPSSPAFISETQLGRTLCIPSIFVSYHGYALDKKLPLLRSDEVLSKAAIKLLKLFNRKEVKKVVSTCGPEQEYFLLDHNYYKLRPDLILTGRTLIGASSPKGQQLEDQYFGSIKERVLNYMEEVSVEAYKMGIPVATRHNEVAPHQFEFAPIFEESNIAADHNQLLMEIMKKVALRHDLVCLLHEKPFAGINGSGKHVNWSIADDQGNNLLNPGQTPQDNLQFLAILVAVLRAVNRHADLLRASIASAGNEHRLGANEAPPAIVSVFLGEQLTNILDTIENGAKHKVSKKDIIDLGVGRLPKVNKDATDRNRTSTFAFTGTKFEFRAVGSSQNISWPLTVINTIIADSLNYVAAEIARELKSKDLDSAVISVIAMVAKENKQIRFEGNNYSPEWVREAAERGLPNVAATAEALAAFTTRENIEIFEKQGVLSQDELMARYNIWVEMYNIVLTIEANTLREMVDSIVVPAGFEYQGQLAENLERISRLRDKIGLNIDDKAFDDLKGHLADVTNKIYYVRKNTQSLVKLLDKAKSLEGKEKAEVYFNELKPLMEHIRKHSDDLECVIADEHWDLPKYREMLFVM
ncbi:MAG: glutamine synthetase III [Elusimicrobia bacterium]|nr:glutamine synthetase III [Elusimicrobiota bacterium]